MKSKKIILVVFILATSLISNAQLEGKKFRKNFEGMGLITLEFKTETFGLTNSAGITLVEGRYRTEEKVLFLTDISGPIACPSEIVGKYEFVLTESDLKLILKEDNCQGRSVMSSVTWEIIE